MKTVQIDIEFAKDILQRLEDEIEIGEKPGAIPPSRGLYDVTFHFRDAIRNADREPQKSVLMSAENHTGWKLEELLAQLIYELHGKSQKIALDGSDLAREVHGNNLAILDCLYHAEQIQRDSYRILDKKAPNEGPAGKPRIGESSSS